MRCSMLSPVATSDSLMYFVAYCWKWSTDMTANICCDAGAADGDKTGIAEGEEDEEVPGM